MVQPKRHKLPTPRELGLPEEFTHWRPGQEHALGALLEDERRVKALCAPTGSGKTLIYVGWALWSQEPTCFVTENLGLQDQLCRVFGPVGMVDLRGRDNYPCAMRDDYTCQDGYAARCPYKGTVTCPSSQAEMRAASSSLVTTNYAKWLSARRFGTGMSHFKRVVFDEGHYAPTALGNAMQVRLGHKEVVDLTGMDFPRPNEAEDFTNWKAWIREAKYVALEAIEHIRPSLSADAQPQVIRHYLRLRRLHKRLVTLAGAKPENWIVDETEKGYQFDPIRPGVYTEGMLFIGIPNVLIVSATIRPKTLFMLNQPNGSFQFTEIESDWDAGRCPIYWIPTMRVDHRNPDLRMLWVRHDQIAAKRRDRNAIVHTISFARRDDILGNSRFASSMLINEKGEPTTDTIEQFKNSPAGTILVSPSVGTGYDFPMAECEWQFICKVPFPDSRSKIIRARQSDDKEYGPLHAMTAIVQIAGRARRRKEDSCENFIGDDHIEWFLRRWGYLAPKAFHRNFQRVDTLPPPFPKL